MAAPDLQAEWDRAQSLSGSDSPGAAQDRECREMTELGSSRRNARAQQPPNITWHLKEAFSRHPVGPLEKGVTHWTPIQHLQEGACAPTSHRDISPCPLHTWDSSVLGTTITRELQEWEQPLEQRQMGEGMQLGQEETFEIHTGMKKLWFFLLPLKDSTT